MNGDWENLFYYNTSGSKGFNTKDMEQLCIAVTRHDPLENQYQGYYKIKLKIIRDIGVETLIPVIDTILAGVSLISKAVVRNNGWIREIFPATFKIGAGYTNTKSCSLNAKSSDTISFVPWTAIKGRFVTSCSVYISSDINRQNDTLRGHLTVLQDTWLVRANTLQPNGYGGSLTSVGDTYIYALAGNSKAFMRYEVKNNNWIYLCSLPSAITTGGALTWWNNTDFIYTLRGRSTQGFDNPLYRYRISNNTWTLDTNFSFLAMGPASRMCYVRHNDSNYLYIITGHVSHTGKFMRYHLTQRRVDFLPRYPDTIGAGVSLCWDCGNNLYMLRGGNNYFYCYNLSSDTWSRVANTTNWVGEGGALTYYPFSSKVFGWNGRYGTATTTAMMRYNPSNNSWTRYVDPPQRADFGGALSTAQNTIFALRGGGYNDFWQYWPVIDGTKELAYINDLIPTSLPNLKIFKIHPNPFKGYTSIKCNLPQTTELEIKIYDISGKSIKNLVSSKQKDRGEYEFLWDGKDNNSVRLASGVYFIKVKIGELNKTQKCILTE